MSAIWIMAALGLIAFALLALTLYFAGLALKFRRRAFLRALLVAFLWSLLSALCLLFVLTLPASNRVLAVITIFCCQTALECLSIRTLMKTTWPRALGGWGLTLATRFLMVIAVIFQINPRLLQSYTIPSASMSPTLQPADRFFATKVLTPQRWDLVTFHWGKEMYVKRVVGLPGEEISIDPDGHLWINRLDAGSPPDRPGATFPWPPPLQIDRMTMRPAESLLLGPAEYFVIGDVSESSVDSRYFGPVKTSDLDGVVTLIYWPLDRMRIVR